MRSMNKPKALAALLAVALFALGLGACGGSGEDASTTASTSTQATMTPSNAARPGSRGGGGGKGATGEAGVGAGPQTAKAESKAPSATANQKPASLKTDPASIPKAITTAKGAVQTLAPSAGGQEEAMDNSYTSIKAFGEESSGQEATDITYALVQYLSAKANGDSATACARLNSYLVDSLIKTGEKSKDPAIAQGGCPAAYADLMKNTPKAISAEAAEIDVASVRRGGDRAFVIYKTPGTLSADMPMNLQGGVWVVGALESYVLTPAQLGENREGEQQ